jgi:hypothetical protein
MNKNAKRYLSLIETSLSMMRRAYSAETMDECRRLRMLATSLAAAAMEFQGDYLYYLAGIRASLGY